MSQYLVGISPDMIHHQYRANLPAQTGADERSVSELGEDVAKTISQLDGHLFRDRTVFRTRSQLGARDRHAAMGCARRCVARSVDCNLHDIVLVRREHIPPVVQAEHLPVSQKAPSL